jgi:amino acid adenylation domain-containing protein
MNEACVHQLVAANAPGRLALVSGEETLTYGELEARANQLAHRLAGLGISRGDTVAVLLDRSPAFVIAALAILKAGGNYLPLNPRYPASRLDAMVTSAGVSVVITAPRLVDRVPAGAAACLASGEGPQRDPRIAVHPDDLAYTMFTSGSTGTPKGVHIPHRGVVRLVREPDYVHLDQTDVVLHASSVSFDAATFEIWGALVNGARLVIAKPDSSAVELARLVREHQVTTALLPTGLFHVMISECRDELAGLRQLVVGGDVVSPGHALKMLRTAPGCQLVNAYGPTEITTIATAYRVPAGHDPAKAIPIGWPIRATRTAILDTGLAEVPARTAGQLYVGGDGLARGYLGDPARTAERFIPDPSTPGQRLYATGDLARYGDGGQIEFLGRMDRQVKIRGFRVEPGEIEQALRADPDVSDAVVLAHGNTADERRLIAYVVPEPDAAGPQAGGSAIRARLRERVPDYLVPDLWVTLDALPVTANGKVDLRALPVPARPVPVPTPAAVPSVVPSEVEAMISRIWCELLELDTVDPAADFFELGGHSLLAHRMVSRLRSALDVQIPLGIFFDNPTIAQLAKLVDQAV